MDFSKRQADPRRHAVGFVIVVAFHVAVVYALVTGLAKKVVDVVRAPIETKVIEEIKKPPPPETVAPPPPKLEAPPPPFIPPPEVVVAPPPPAPTVAIAPSPVPPPPAPVEIVPTPPPAPEPVIVAAPPPPAPAPPPPAPAPPSPPAPPPPKPTVASLDGVCPKTVTPATPAIAAYVGKVVVTVKYTILGGKITKVDVVKESYAPNLDRRGKRAVLASIEAAAAEYVCTGDHADVTQEFSFNLI